jgi:hypothetical protein
MTTPLQGESKVFVIKSSFKGWMIAVSAWMLAICPILTISVVTIAKISGHGSPHPLKAYVVSACASLFGFVLSEVTRRKGRIVLLSSSLEWHGNEGDVVTRSWDKVEKCLVGLASVVITFKEESCCGNWYIPWTSVPHRELLKFVPKARLRRRWTI